MKKGILLHPSMGQHIINHLSQLAPLPAKGVLAGQAVASAIMDLYARGGGVYNDLDVFQALETAQELEAFKAAQTKKYRVGTVEFARPDLHYNTYERLMFVTARDCYKVLSSRKDGLLNTVLYDLYSYRPGLYGKAANLISCFDLNCTRAAVDLENKQLVWTREFEYFINTYQLQVTALQTPFHTAIRFANKLRQMPAIYGDVALSMEIIAAAHTRLDRREQTDRDTSSHVRSLFGRVHAGAFETNEGVLAPYFELEDTGYGTFTLRPHDIPDEKLATIFTPDEFGGSILFGAGRAYASRLKASKIVQDRRAWTAPILAEKYKTHWVMKHALELQGDTFLGGQVSTAHLPRIANVMRKHSALTHLLLEMPLDKQFDVVKRLKRFSKTEGPWVYGLAETAATPNDVDTDEAFLQLVTHERDNFFTPLVEPAFPNGLQLGPIKITEFLNRAALYDEGAELDHCVGGYGTTILKGNRIFSIQDGEGIASRSTLMFGPRPSYFSKHTGKYHELEHKSYANGKTTRRQDIAALYVEMRLNGVIKMSAKPLSGWRQMLFELRQVSQEVTRREEAIEAEARRLKENQQKKEAQRLTMESIAVEDDESIPF